MRKTFPYATIKINLVRDVKKIGKANVEYKDLFYTCDVKYGLTTTMTSEKTLRKLLKSIKEILFI